MVRKVSGILAVVCALTASVALAQTPKTLRVVPLLEVRLLDPYVNTNYGTRNHGHMIYEQLYALDSKQQPKPMMVGEHTASPDGLTHRFQLRPGLKWHDGQPVTSADVIASLEKWVKKDGFGGKLGAVTTGMKVDGADAFVISLKEPFPLILDALAKPSGNAPFILPERFAKMPDGSPDFQAVGSGPFVFKRDEWKPGAKSVYVKNPDYRPREEPADGMAGGKVVKFDRVEWITMPDVNTAANALMAGEVDIYENPAFDLLAPLKADSGVRVEVTDNTGNQPYLRMNHLYPPFNNPKARQALLHLVDQDLYGRAAAGDPAYYRVCPAFLMCGSPWGSTAGAVKPDLEKARALMKEAGYNGEKVIVLHPTTNPAFEAATLLTADRLRKIGVNVETQQMDYNTMLIRRSKRDAPAQGGWHLAHSGNFGVDVASPMTNIYLATSCEKAAAGWPCDREIEDLKDAFARAASVEERKAIAEKIQIRAMEFVPYVPVMQTYTLVAYRKSLTGMVNSPLVVYWGVDRAR